MHNENNALTVNQLVTELVKSPHGNLQEYGPIALRAIGQDPYLFHHLIAWNEKKGQVRDAKVALPVYGLAGVSDVELVENSLAHLAKLDPRNLLRAVRHAKEVKPGKFRAIRRMVTEYLEVRAGEPQWMEKTILQHRASVKGLYAFLHLKVPPHVGGMLSWGKSQKPLAGSVLEILKRMKTMSPMEAAGMVMIHKIPFLTAVGAMPKIKDNTAALIALVKSMSPSELVTNTGMLEKLGMKTDVAVQAEYRKALESLKKDSRKTQNLFKAGAAANVVKDEVVAKTLREVQEKQFSKKRIEGNWAVLVDRSGSMQLAIEVGKLVAAALAKMVKDKVWMVFFNDQALVKDVTGMTLENIQKTTKGVIAQGGTGIGGALMALQGKQLDGIAVISDGGENRHPVFATYHKEHYGDVPVYFYKLSGDPDIFTSNCEVMQTALSTFDLRSAADLDYYSVANLVETMRTNRYGLYQEIMDTPLLSLRDVFITRKEKVAYAE